MERPVQVAALEIMLMQRQEVGLYSASRRPLRSGHRWPSYIEWIERFLLATATPEEQTQLDALIAKDPIVAEEVNAHRKLIQLLREHAQVAQLRREMQTQRETPSHAGLTLGGPSKRPLRWALAAGLLILVIGSFWFDMHTTNSPKEATHIGPSAQIGERDLPYTEPLWPLQRSQASVIDHAVRLHLKGHTDEALDLLLQGDDPVPEARQWAVEIMVHAGRYTDALPILHDLALNTPEQQRIRDLLKICQTHLHHPAH
jgi:hypothetical protein